MTILILSLCLVAFVTLSIIYIFKYKKLKTDFIKMTKPLRTGYYSNMYTQRSKNNLSEIDEIDYKAIVFVDEVDRFTNGESKIIFKKLELSSDSSEFKSACAEKFIRDRFVSIIQTSDVTWLESEQSIKNMRKEKLAQLSKNK